MTHLFQQMRALFCLIAFSMVLSVLAQVPCDVHGCTYADAVEATTIDFGGDLGRIYSPKCIRVTSGTVVTFNGTFADHPLVSGAGKSLSYRLVLALKQISNTSDFFQLAPRLLLKELSLILIPEISLPST